jgi:threonine dehydrogenase-like Zn-dependent dehydrogenase
MKANCWYGKKNVRVEDVPDPKILNSRDAIVQVSSTAICGSDLHLYNGFMPTLERGDILGHEFMGEVVEVGAGVTNLKVGDRVVVPFPIACGACTACATGLWSLCENSNPNAWMAEKLWGHSPAGLFGYTHLMGGYAGGQAEYARVPFADVGPIKVPDGLSDEQVLFLSDIFPTGYMGAEMCDIKPGDVIAVWGAGPVGQFAIASAKLLGAERVIAIDRFPYRLRLALEKAGATDIINYEKTDVHEALKEMTGGRGPDACIDAVGLEAHAPSLMYGLDRAKQSLMLETDRPLALRQAIRACKNGGTVSVIGVYGGLIDQFPMGAIVNRSLTLRSGQCHVHRYLKPLLERIERGEIDPSFVITHRLPLWDAPKGYDMFVNKLDGCEKVVLKASGGVAQSDGGAPSGQTLS